MLTQSTSPRRANRIAALGLAFLMLLAVAATVPAVAASPAPAELDGSVNWQEPPLIVSNVDRVAYPRGAISANNVTNIVYYTASGDVMFTSNATGVFNLAGKRLDSTSSELGPDRIASIAAGPNNVLGIVYTTKGRDEQIYFRESFDGGLNWTPRERVSSGEKATTPDLTFDSEGNAHMVWIDNRCDTHQYNVYYRVHFANGLLGDVSKPRDACGTYQKSPEIVMAGGKPQVVFMNSVGRDSEIHYRRLEGSQWIGQSVSASNGVASQNGTITSDGGNNIFVAWDENISGNTNHEIFFRASFDGGLTWTNSVDMSGGSTGISTNPHLTWSPSAKRAYLVWQDEHGGSSGRPEIWEREFDPNSLSSTPYTFADQISHTGLRSLWPSVAAGTSKAAIVWQDEPSGTRPFQVYVMGGQVIGTACDGSLLLNGGVDTTRDRTLSGTITPKDGCVPDQMQVSLDTPVTDATPKIVYSPSLPPQTVPEGGCIHTVYVRLFKGGSGGTAFSDSIQVDSTVDASVRITNPHLNGQPSSGGAPGAQDGDPRYTRDLQFYLGIHDADECSGLLNFKVQGGSNVAIPAAGYSDTVPLPGGSTPPARNVSVTVTDKIGNSENFQNTMIFDSGAPTLVMSANPTVTVPLSTTSIIVSLSFENITVNDNIYGDLENLNAGRRFWGVWIANSRTPTAPTDPAKWLPVEVPTHASDFTINWSLFGGLGDQANPAGDYYVFVRFLDGAGNPTTAVLQTTQLTLEDNFTLPTLYLPSMHKQ